MKQWTLLWGISLNCLPTARPAASPLPGLLPLHWQAYRLPTAKPTASPLPGLLPPHCQSYYLPTARPTASPLPDLASSTLPGVLNPTARPTASALTGLSDSRLPCLLSLHCQAYGLPTTRPTVSPLPGLQLLAPTFRGVPTVRKLPLKKKYMYRPKQACVTNYRYRSPAWTDVKLNRSKTSSDKFYSLRQIFGVSVPVSDVTYGFIFFVLFYVNFH